MRYLILFAFFGRTVMASAQITPATDTLPPSAPSDVIITRAVEISAARLTISDIKAPMAVTVLDQAYLQTAARQLSMYEHLTAVPGVFAMNPDNFSQDLRISIRGFGARAAFGIRGIRIFTDGIPEGTPDGQVDVDNIDMGIVRQMEVLRGAASGLYGNAAGGVIYLSTENPVQKKPMLEIQATHGAFGFQRYQLKTGQHFGKFLYFLNATYHKTEGYRDWSTMENTVLNGKMTYLVHANCRISLLANVGSSPRANDPGALTAQQIKENPRQAGANNLLFETGEAVSQSRIGLTYDHRLTPKHRIQGRLFSTVQQLKNRLAIASNGYGDLSRQYQGGYVSYQFDGKIGAMAYRLKTGIDLENQADTRLRFAYQAVVVDSMTRYQPAGNVLHQLESFQSAGIYLLQEIHPIPALLVSVSGRYDDLNMHLTDRFSGDGDQSGGRHFNKINPVLGVNYSVTEKASLYANYASTFESPTLNELSNNPDGTGGFNPMLAPQQSGTFELGAKGYLPFKNAKQALHFDLAIYRIETRNDIVPFQISGQPGKTYYRNAGTTLRNGLEIGLSYPVLKGLNAFFTQTWSNFQYKTYTVNGTSFEGNRLPGIPGMHTRIELRYFHTKGFFALVEGRHVRKVYANDANSAFAAPYTVFQVRLGHRVTFKGFFLEPFIGVNNLANSRYIANVQINASNDRFFEPAAARSLWGGIKMRINR